jgi:hypothetical protein
MLALPACTTLFLPKPGMSGPDLYRTLAQCGGSLCSTHHTFVRSAHADWLCHGRRSWKQLGRTDGVGSQSPDEARGWFESLKSARYPRLGCWVWMIFVFAAAGAMERSSSISNGGFPSTCFPIEKPRRAKSGGFPIPVWSSSAGIAEARLRDLGEAGSAASARQVADRWHLLKNLSETMQSFFREPRNLCSSP